MLKGPRDVEERQRTLRATIAWSHGLLEEAEQGLFRRLAVFVGGASLSAIEEVCEADLEDLLSLVAKSLVRQLPGEEGEPRYWMLETIREFALEELEASGEADALRARHLAWCVGSVPEPDSEELDTLEGERLARVELDLANLRSAFTWSAERSDGSSASFSLAAVLWQRHLHRGRYAEAEDVARSALSLDLEPLDAVYFHDRLGVLQRLRGRSRDASTRTSRASAFSKGSQSAVRSGGSDGSTSNSTRRTSSTSRTSKSRRVPRSPNSSRRSLRTALPPSDSTYCMRGCSTATGSSATPSPRRRSSSCGRRTSSTGRAAAPGVRSPSGSAFSGGGSSTRRRSTSREGSKTGGERGSRFSRCAASSTGLAWCG